MTFSKTIKDITFIPFVIKDTWTTIRDLSINQFRANQHVAKSIKEILDSVEKFTKNQNDFNATMTKKLAYIEATSTSLGKWHHWQEEFNTSLLETIISEKKLTALLRDNFDSIDVNISEQDIQLELDFLAGNLMCEKEMKLKIGAQVMCIINIKSDQGDILICNGSQGIIIDFCNVSGCPKVKYNNGIEMVMMRHIWLSDKIPGIGVSQIPLILSWALTIHKSQGATLDAAEIDVGSGIFECGQTYVALSRVKSLDGLYLTSFDAKRIRINKKVKEYYEALTLFQEQNQVQEHIVEVQAIPVAIPIAIATVVSSTTEANQNPFSSYNYLEPEPNV
jgi:ATP-dependent exoDNAse (exonuclease V) alpha subunit